jgi:hypothetical protein
MSNNPDPAALAAIDAAFSSRTARRTFSTAFIAVSILGSKLFALLVACSAELMCLLAGPRV